MARHITNQIHPVTWMLFALAQLLVVLIGDNTIMLIVMTAFNCATIYYSATLSFVKRIPRLVLYSAIWGAIFLPIFRCHSISYECAKGVGSYLSKILVIFSGFGMLGAVIDGNRFMALLISRGIPLPVCVTLSRVVSFLAELVNSGADAYAIHQLAGRAVKTRRERFKLLVDIVTSTVFRVLVRCDDISKARESRLPVNDCTPQLSVDDGFTVWDVVLLSGTFLLVTVFVAN